LRKLTPPSTSRLSVCGTKSSLVSANTAGMAASICVHHHSGGVAWAAARAGAASALPAPPEPRTASARCSWRRPAARRSARLRLSARACHACSGSSMPAWRKAWAPPRPGSLLRIANAAQSALASRARSLARSTYIDRRRRHGRGDRAGQQQAQAPVSWRQAWKIGQQPALGRAVSAQLPALHRHGIDIGVVCDCKKLSASGPSNSSTLWSASRHSTGPANRRWKSSSGTRQRLPASGSARAWTGALARGSGRGQRRFGGQRQGIALDIHNGDCAGRPAQPPPMGEP
jgi:hypothetical protein